MTAVILLACVLFALGVLGLLLRRNFLFIILSLEVMINSAAFLWVGASVYWGSAEGQVMFLFVAAAAATEMAIGLALLIAYDRLFKTSELG
ncbi:MAG: NADH-quinone oxidoreductase subunit NuoK [Deltaproteobacteria bacterium]|nr:NADH-quinone oxidoreductase subunit NuoK [Deltaproteobacteria bacterium]